MGQARRTYYTASRKAKAPFPDRVVVKVHADRDAAEWEYGLLKQSDADKVRMAAVPRGIAGRADAAEVIRANLIDQGW